MCGRGGVPALLLLLLLAALAGGAGTRTERRRRQTEVVVAGGGAAGAAGAAGADEGGEAGWRALWEGALEALRREPQLNNTHEDVLAQLGGVAFLHCPVRDLGERGVSWVRRRDWHILSAGLFMYTSDERFQVLHADGRDDWTLQIKYVQQRDNGTYECQVSTSGGVLSRQVTLHVAVPEAFILGADEHHVHQGSALSLICIIEKSPVPPQYVFWFHNERMINYDAAAGVSVRTEPGAKTQSTLTVRRAAPEHGGNYSCRAPNTEPARIIVYVTQGSDKMAATLSRSGAPRTRGAPSSPALPLAAAAALLAAAALSALPLPHRHRTAAA